MSKTSKIGLLILMFTVQCTQFMSKTSKDIKMYRYLFQEEDPDRNKSWFELGAEIGLDIVDDEEVEAEVDQIEADEEVARIYEDAKNRHRKIMTGGFK